MVLVSFLDQMPSSWLSLFFVPSSLLEESSPHRCVFIAFSLLRECFLNVSWMFSLHLRRCTLRSSIVCGPSSCFLGRRHRSERHTPETEERQRPKSRKRDDESTDDWRSESTPPKMQREHSRNIRTSNDTRRWGELSSKKDEGMKKRNNVTIEEFGRRTRPTPRHQRGPHWQTFLIYIYCYKHPRSRW